MAELSELVESLRFIQKLRDGGVIISTNDMSAEEISEARAGGRMFVDADGFGYVYLESGN